LIIFMRSQFAVRCTNVRGTLAGGEFPPEAIRLARTHTAGCCLLITDVVIPEVNGREQAEQIAKYSAGLRTWFRSGYTANVIAHHGLLNGGVYFIQMPLSKNEPAARVGSALNGPSDGTGP
jgi:FixJ family two-component response regulator